MKWWDRMPWSSFFECWVLNQLFHSPLSPSSRGSLVLCFLPLGWCHHSYLRLLIFLPAILIPDYVSSSLAFHMMYSVCKLNKRSDSKQPWHTPFLILNQSIVLCPVLTITSWPAYRFLRRQERWSGIPISGIFQFVAIHIVKGFSVVNEADIFLEFSCFFYDPMDVGNLVSGCSAFSKSSLYTWKFSVKVKMKSLSHVRLFAAPWAVAYQSPLSMALSRQEYWSGLPFPSPGNLPDPGIEPGSLALQADTLPSEPPGKCTPGSSQYTYLNSATPLTLSSAVVIPDQICSQLWRFELEIKKKKISTESVTLGEI